MPPTMGTASVVRGDARHLPLADDSVDLVVMSPPYYALRSYTDGGQRYDGQTGSEATPREYVDALLDVTAECARVLKPTGSIFANLGDRYASNSNGSTGHRARSRDTTAAPRGRGDRFGMPPKTLMGLPWRYANRVIDELGLILRAEVIWNKPNGMPDSAPDRVRRSHEHLFHFTTQPRYYSALPEIFEPHLQPDRRRADVFGGVTAVNGVRHSGATVYTGPTAVGRPPGSVWEISTEPLIVPDWLGVAHYAAFPVEIPRRCILGWSPRPSVILDPFAGTGTVPLVAKALGRFGIGVDMSEDYCRLARWRTNDRNQLAKAARKPKPPPIPEGQMALWD